MSTVRKSLTRLVAGVVVGSGAVAARLQQRRRRRDHRVYILEYHGVGEGAAEAEGIVSAARFRRHLRYLKRHFRFASLQEAVAGLAAPSALGEDLVVVTFDDGYASNYDCAWPVLREEKVRAAIFVTSGFLDGRGLWFDLARHCLKAAVEDGTRLSADLEREFRAVFGRWPLRQPVDAAVERLKRLPPAARDALLRQLEHAYPRLSPGARPLRWHQVREMLAGGIEIGCHTVSHPILSTLPAAQQADEITRSRDRVAEETGLTPTLFAYPNGAIGDFGTATIGIVREAGFTAACTTIRGSNRPGCDPLTLRRIGVGAEPCFVVAARLAGIFDESVRLRFARGTGTGGAVRARVERLSPTQEQRS